MIIRALITAALVGSTIAATAAPVKKTYRARQKLAIQSGGTFVLDNPVGNVQIVGSTTAEAEAVVTRVITGTDDDTAEVGRKNTTTVIGGDERMRVARTVITTPPKGWSANVLWQVTLPKNVSVRVVSRVSQTIQIKDILGGIYVRNVNGTVVLENVAAAATVESINGSIIYSTAQPRGNALLSTINGNITATLAPDADFRWNAESLAGDILTNFPARGAFTNTTFVSVVNAPGGPSITTLSAMGTIRLLTTGAPVSAAQSIKRPQKSSVVTSGMMSASTGAPKPEVSGGVYKYATNIGDVRVPEIAGSTEITTGAGVVQLGSVSGYAKVVSFGGPLQLGEVSGPINASTRAGDILVDSARRGGVLSTKGGTIRLLYTSGPTRLESGGGDIIVRQAAAPIQAETRSGDISITLDPGLKTEKITAMTMKGNIVLNVPARFAADVDATIETLDANADTIVSDLPGLAISRQPIDGGRTRIRATGKINGGGERVTLRAIGGDVRITTAGITPTIVAPK